MNSSSFEGLILINKPKGHTSHDVVARVRKTLNIKRVGHAGTLDPLATGLLIVLVGRATRVSDYLLNQDKSYRVHVELGKTTDTLDSDGEVTHTHDGPMPSREDIAETVISTKGLLELEVPLYSAVKVNGQKLYDYARKGQKVEPILREMLFEKVEIEAVGETSFIATMACSKGSFIRAWAAEVGRRLGVGGIVTELVRTSSGPYSLEEATDFETWDGQKGFIPLEQSLRGVEKMELHMDEVSHMLTGRIPGSVIRSNQLGSFSGSVLTVHAPTGHLLAILQRESSGQLKIGCVLPPE